MRNGDGVKQSGEGGGCQGRRKHCVVETARGLKHFVERLSRRAERERKRPSGVRAEPSKTLARDVCSTDLGFADEKKGKISLGGIFCIRTGLIGTTAYKKKAWKDAPEKESECRFWFRPDKKRRHRG